MEGRFSNAEVERGLIERVPVGLHRALARREVSLFHPFAPLGWLGRASAEHIGRSGMHALDEVESMVLFIGYGRSGHSMLGALLDAHPNAVIAHELHVLHYLAHGFTGAQIARLLVENARTFASFGRQWGKYRHHVPGQWQGSWRRLRILGDKAGGGTARLLGQRPELLDRAREQFPWPIRFIHMVRHPEDLVARNWSTRASGSPFGSRLFKQSMDARGALEHVMRNCETVERVRHRVPETDWLDLSHETFVRDPRQSLHRVCTFLGLDADAAYVEACAQLVHEPAHRARDQVNWPPGVRAELTRRATAYSFMAPYLETSDADMPATKSDRDHRSRA